MASIPWGKTTADTLGHVGRTYSLKVVNGTDTFTAQSELKRVPTVDSVVYRHEKWPFEPDKGPREGFVASFYARDLEGVGDTYWIKPVIPRQSGGRQSCQYLDCLRRCIRCRRAIRRADIHPSMARIDHHRLIVSAGAQIGVELHSITYEAFEFLKQVNEQGTNGGLFATPIANVRSNIINADPKGPKALGFFSASAVSRMET